MADTGPLYTDNRPPQAQNYSYHTTLDAQQLLHFRDIEHTPCQTNHFHVNSSRSASVSIHCYDTTDTAPAVCNVLCTFGANRQKVLSFSINTSICTAQKHIKVSNLLERVNIEQTRRFFR